MHRLNWATPTNERRPALTKLAGMRAPNPAKIEIFPLNGFMNQGRPVALVELSRGVLLGWNPGATSSVSTVTMFLREVGDKYHGSNGHKHPKVADYPAGLDGDRVRGEGVCEGVRV